MEPVDGRGPFKSRWEKAGIPLYIVIGALVCLLILLAATKFSLDEQLGLAQSKHKLQLIENEMFQLSIVQQEMMIDALTKELNLTIEMKELYRKQVESNTYEGVMGTTYRLNKRECDSDP